MYPEYGVSLLSDLLSLIKTAAVDAVNANYPVQLVFAKLSAASPVTVYINQKLPSVGGGFLSVTDSFLRKLESGAVTPGDRVALLQMQGGQKFLLIDKVT